MFLNKKNYTKTIHVVVKRIYIEFILFIKGFKEAKATIKNA